MQGEVVPIVQLPPGRVPAYVPVVPDGPPKLSDLLQRWLVARVEEHPRRSKRAVALALGLPVPTVNRIVNGVRGGNVQLDTVGLIAEHTGFSAPFVLQCVLEERPLPAIRPHLPARSRAAH